MKRYGTLLLAVILMYAATVANAQDTPGPDQLKNEGNLLYQQGDIEGAIVKWEEAIAVDSTYAFAYNNIGIGLYDLGDYAGSSEYLMQAVALDTTYAKAYNSLGNALLALGELELALDSYQVSLEYEPYDAETLSNLGTVYFARGDYTHALELFEEAIDRDKNHAPAHNNRGLILERLGELDDAVDSFRDAIKADSNFLDAYINLGAHYCRREDPDEKFVRQGIDYLERAQQIDPDNPAILFNLGLCHLKDGVPARARQILNDLLEQTPDDPNVHYALGLAHSATKMYDLAQKSFTEAFSLDPSFSRARIALNEISPLVP